jgi:pimeloyl-ACP methyl ester carboxylesterase
MSPQRRWCLVSLVLGGLLMVLLPGTARGVVILFKDGFVIQGRVTVPTEIIVDKATGKPYVVPAGNAPFSVEDGVRHTLFSPKQVENVLPDRGRDSPLMELKRFAPSFLGPPLPGLWEMSEIGKWSSKWQRHVTLNTPKGALDLDQRLTMLTPKLVCVDALRYNWRPFYQTRELDGQTVRKLLYDYYGDAKKKKTPEQTRVLVARFLLQAGWTDLARKELDGLKAATSQQEEAGRLLETIRRVEAGELADAVQAAFKAGQYARARHDIERFFKDGASDRADEKVVSLVQDLKTRLEADGLRLEQARGFLQALPAGVAEASREFYVQKTAVVLTELNLDTLPRLEKFIELARPAALAKKQGRAPAQSAEQLLNYALTGWVLGNEPAEDDTALARDLWQTRERVLKYQRSHDEAPRQALLAAHKANSKLGPDLVARLLRYLPPPEPPAKAAPGMPLSLRAAPLGASRGARYLVQLPPEYHVGRAYPLLIVLHRGTEEPKEMLAKWAELAARDGFLLAAPEWGGPAYGYSADEHAAVLDCLRDLRQRFAVDSDRAFVFGAEAGGLLAYDVGLSHPGEFAGILVMSAAPYYFAASYRTNAQYLPFYVVDGDRDGTNTAANKGQFERWVRRNYPALLVQYRGRGKDWFGAEPPLMMDWMNRKTRANPAQELGWSNVNEEFETMRPGDNRFYWLSTDGILPGHVNDAGRWSRTIPPATLQAKITGGNLINVRARGFRQVTVWLAPGTVNFGQPVRVSFNGRPVVRPMKLRPGVDTLLEDFYQRGDRQRLYVAKIDLK